MDTSNNNLLLSDTLAGNLVINLDKVQVIKNIIIKHSSRSVKMVEVKVIYGTGTDIVGDTYYSTDHAGIQKAIDYVYSQGGGKSIYNQRYLSNKFRFFR